MIVAGLDIASRVTGFCVGDGTTVPRADVFRFPQFDEDLGALLDAFDRSLCVMFDTFKPDVLVYEAPILVVKKNRKGGYETAQTNGAELFGHNGGPALEDSSPGYTDKLLKIRKLYSMGSYLEFFCLRRGVECSEVTIQAIKKEVTGDRFADKAELVSRALACGVDLPKGEVAKDAADAWGAWLLGLRHYNRNVSGQWDVKLVRAGMAVHRQKGLL